MKKQKKKNNNWKTFGNNIAFWVVIVIACVLLMQMVSTDGSPQKITFTKYEELINSKNVESAEIVGNAFNGKLINEEYILLPSGKEISYNSFVTILPTGYIDQDIINYWNTNNIKFQFKEKTPNLTDYLIQFTPWILIFVFWIFIMRRMQSGSGQSGIFGFNKSKARIVSPNSPKITFENVAGCDEAKVELEEVVDFLKNPGKYKNIGAKIPRGALLLGPPGTGKTLLARAVAGEAGVPFFNISGAEFVEMFVGVGASRVRDLFENAKNNSPSIIFIDEIDAVGRHRGAGLGGGHDEREQTLNQILVEMDGFETDDNVILLAATNRPDVLDKALLRPGRFDRQIVVDAPGLFGREAILKIHSKDKKMDKNVNFLDIAKGTPGMAGADLENLINESALLAARKGKNKITMQEIEDAKDKVQLGIERKSLILSDEEKKITAYHEAGHALVAFYTQGSDPVHKITIMPRGRALGVTAQLPEGDKHNYQKKYLIGRLNILMGGRSAEKLIFNDTSTGAGNDISVATDIAKKMVTEWGMSDKIGPLTFGSKNDEIFLGREMAVSRDYSDEKSKVIDEEITSFITSAEKFADDTLKKNIDQLHLLSKALLDYETITGTEMKTVLDGKEIVRNEEVKENEKIEIKEEEESVEETELKPITSTI